MNEAEEYFANPAVGRTVDILGGVDRVESVPGLGE